MFLKQNITNRDETMKENKDKRNKNILRYNKIRKILSSYIFVKFCEKVSKKNIFFYLALGADII